MLRWVFVVLFNPFLGEGFKLPGFSGISLPRISMPGSRPAPDRKMERVKVV